MTFVSDSFTDYVENLPFSYGPNTPRTDNVPPEIPGEPLAYEFGRRVSEFMTKWVQTIEPPLFTARALLKDTPLDGPVGAINEKIRDINQRGLPATIQVVMEEHRRPDVGPLDAMWRDVLRRRQDHLNLARQHFSLTLGDVERTLHR